MIEIIEAAKTDKDVLYNLLEKYLYEFSQWEKTDVDEKGLYNYEGLDYYLTENYPNSEVDYDDGTPDNVFFFEN